MDFLKNLLGIGDNIKNFVKDKASNVLNQARSLGNQQANFMATHNPINTIVRPVQNALTLNQAQKVKNPVLRTAAEIGQGIVNTPANILKGFGDTAEQIQRSDLRKPSDWLKIAGNAGTMATDMASLVYGGGAAKNVASQAFKMPAKQTFSTVAKQGFIQGAKPGAIFGAGYGASQGLKEGDNVHDQILNALKEGSIQTAIGLIMGGGLGAGTASVGLLAKKGVQEAKLIGKDIEKIRNPYSQKIVPQTTHTMDGAITTPQAPNTVSREATTGLAGRTPNGTPGYKYPGYKEPVFIDTVKDTFKPESATFKFMQQPKAGMGIEDVTRGGTAVTPKLAQEIDNSTVGMITQYQDIPNLKFDGSQELPENMVNHIFDDIGGKAKMYNAGDNVADQLKQQFGSKKYTTLEAIRDDAMAFLSKQSDNIPPAKTLEQIQKEAMDYSVQKDGRWDMADNPSDTLGRKYYDEKLNELKAQNGIDGGIATDKKPSDMANMGINTDHLNVGDEAKANIDQAMTDLKPTIEQTVGKVMSKEEVQQAAEATAKTLQKTLTREEILDIGAKAMNLRQEIATLSEKGVVTPELIDALKRDKEFSSGTARLLQQRSIDVDPGEKNPMLQMIQAVTNKVGNIDDVLKAAEGVDFNDANQSAVFYRQFIKPKVGDWLDLLRYNSMLSSPLTHIVNISSNLVNSGAVAPIEKTAAGSIDFLRSAITGKERQQFAGEGASFLVGYAKSLGEASHRFADVMTGKKASTNLDVRNIPLIPGSKTEATLAFPMKLLEGMDQFFTALTEGGERSSLQYRQGKGVAVPNMEKQVRDKSAYRIFRQDLHADGQGTLLDAIDTVTGMVMKARNSENPIIRNIAKWTIPFIKTPMNIFKQGIEYSPAGFATAIGAENKTEQIAKAAVGSAIFSGAAMLLESGRLTWGEPINEKDKNAFRAAGMQPYSVKLGETWYSYQKLPPGLAFSIAMVAAMDDTQKNAKLGDDTVDQILTSIAKYGQFLSDQSYAKSIGDLLTAAKGGESGISRLLSNYPQQVVPFRAFGGWLARLTDDVQRKVDPEGSFIDKQVQQLMMNIPGLSDDVPARKDNFGNDIVNNNNVANSFSPVKMSDENKTAADSYNTQILDKREEARRKELRAQVKDGGRLKEQNPDISQAANDYIYAYELEKYTGDNNETGIKKYTLETEKMNVARNIFGGADKYKDLPEDVKPEIYKAMGLDTADVEYDYVASQADASKAAFVIEELKSAELDHNGVIQALVNGRKESVSGKMVVSNGVIDELYNQDLITSAEKTALKKIKIGSDGQVAKSATGGAKKGAKASVSSLVSALKKSPVSGKGGKTRASGVKTPSQVKVPNNTVNPTLQTNVAAPAIPKIDQLIQANKAKFAISAKSDRKLSSLVRGGGGSSSKAPVKLSQSFYRGGRA